MVSWFSYSGREYIHDRLWIAPTVALDSLIEPVHSLRIVALMFLHQYQVGKEFVDASIWESEHFGKECCRSRRMLLDDATDGELAFQLEPILRKLVVVPHALSRRFPLEDRAG